MSSTLNGHISQTRKEVLSCTHVLWLTAGRISRLRQRRRKVEYAKRVFCIRPEMSSAINSLTLVDATAQISEAVNALYYFTPYFNVAQLCCLFTLERKGRPQRLYMPTYPTMVCNRR
uniref:Uncharacterized protein n=1 Tax=Trichobilharzia regenti TaxID=157069 RepID=A0AA85IUE6_TRIRE|nr:unnamed protein product [Trichobilharzia regenti]